MEIRKASTDDLNLLCKLAHGIWWESYKGILSDVQIAFMLEKMYSQASIQNQMNAGAVFIIIRQDEEAMGFASYQFTEVGILRIHKLYFLKSAQGKGLGKAVIAYVENVAKSQNAHAIELNVNRGNPAYHFYLKQGFSVREEVDIPYYQFVLNDYVMRKTL